MPIRRMRQYANLVRAGDGNESERLALLLAHRETVRQQLRDVRDNLATIDFKIDIYNERIADICKVPHSEASA